MFGTSNAQSSTNGGAVGEELSGYIRWFFPVVVFNDKLGK